MCSTSSLLLALDRSSLLRNSSLMSARTRMSPPRSRLLVPTRKFTIARMWTPYTSVSRCDFCLVRRVLLTHPSPVFRDPPHVSLRKYEGCVECWEACPVREGERGDWPLYITRLSFNLHFSHSPSTQLSLTSLFSWPNRRSSSSWKLFGLDL